MIFFKNFEDLSSDVQLKFKDVYVYISEFLTSEHPSRSGNVCPFISRSLLIKSTYFLAVDIAELGNIDEIIAVGLAFQKATNSDLGKIGSVVIMFPVNVKVSIPDQAQIRNKVKAVKIGLMLGSLNRDNNSSSLHNKNFFPLRAPSPIIVIRNMVYTDLNFLNSEVINKVDRKVFLESYIKNFGGSPSNKIKTIF